MWCQGQRSIRKFFVCCFAQSRLPFWRNFFVDRLQPDCNCHQQKLLHRSKFTKNSFQIVAKEVPRDGIHPVRWNEVIWWQVQEVHQVHAPPRPLLQKCFCRMHPWHPIQLKAWEFLGTLLYHQARRYLWQNLFHLEWESRSVDNHQWQKTRRRKSKDLWKWLQTLIIEERTFHKANGIWNDAPEIRLNIKLSRRDV